MIIQMTAFIRTKQAQTTCPMMMKQRFPPSPKARHGKKRIWLNCCQICIRSLNSHILSMCIPVQNHPTSGL